MKIAMYKGHQEVFQPSRQLVDGGIYSHCEIVFSDGVASSSQMDGGFVQST